MTNPTTHYLYLAVHVLHDLAGTISHGITYKSQSRPSLQFFSDADFPTARDRKSHTGHVMTVSGAPVTLVSKKQSTVSL